MEPLMCTTPTASYLICCLPRSGSWLLADALKATCIAGVPEEYYWDEFYDDYLGHWGYPEIRGYDEFLALTHRAGTTPNGVFGAKLHWGELGQLDRNLRSLPDTAGRSTFELLTRFFPQPRFVHLRRQDKVRQAISWFRAGSTAGWYSVRGEKNGPRRPKIAPDWERIYALERILRSDEHSWQRFFARAGVQPLTITYEDLSADYEPTVTAVLAYLDLKLPPGFTLPVPRLTIQRDAATERWVQLYLVQRRQIAPPTDGFGGLVAYRTGSS